ncbi:MAG TPA: hypothetical protein VF193_02450 [Steroidobacter sp.]
MGHEELRSPMEHLRRDLYAVARDAEALLKATADLTNDRVQEVRARTEKSLQQALEHLSQNRLRSVARRTDTYAREQPWAVAGLAAAVGVLIGLMARRR